MKDIEEASDKYLIYSAFNAINKIYALEYSVDYSKDDYLEQINSVREKARELLENADTVMNELIKRHMISNKNKKGDIYSRAWVYTEFISLSLRGNESCTIQVISFIEKNGPGFCPHPPLVIFSNRILG